MSRTMNIVRNLFAWYLPCVYLFHYTHTKKLVVKYMLFQIYINYVILHISTRDKKIRIQVQDSLNSLHC